MATISNATFMLQTSTNLDFSYGSLIGPLSGVEGSFEFIDDQATNTPQRFYRFKP